MQKGLRIHGRSVKRWCKAWSECGEAELISKGPVSLPVLSDELFAKLEAELDKGMCGAWGQVATLSTIWRASSCSGLPVSEGRAHMAERDVRIFRGDEVQSCVLSISEPAYHDYRFVLHASWGAVHAAGHDLFATLANLRRELETSGWMIAVQGSRKQAYASGMIRDMHGATRVYICATGRIVTRADLVDIFAEAPVDDIVTVEEQGEWYKAWRASLPRSPGSSGSR